MKHLFLIAALAGSCVYAQSPEMIIVNSAVSAMGGKDRVLSVRTIKIYGYGQQVHQNGGGNIVADPDAPQKWVNINGSVRTIDLEHRRMRLQQRVIQDFVFALAQGMNGDVRVNQGLDGDVAYNVAQDGKIGRAPEAVVRARRIQMLDNPLSIVRIALDPASKLSNLHKDGTRQVLDLITPKGDRVEVAFDEGTHLPAWMSWVAPDGNLGDVTYKTHYTGYQEFKGLRLPWGYNTIQDWRNLAWLKLYVDKYEVDVPADDLAVSAEVRNTPLPAPRVLNIEAVPIAKGIWYLRSPTNGSSTLFEFDDHLTLYEVYGSEQNALAIIAKARSLVPSKPVTQVIVSHHHFDHSGGLRAAVSEGLTIITQRGNIGIFQDMATRPAKMFPDALARSPKPIKFIPVDDKLVLKDKSMEVDVYRMINNSHMADAVLAYAPSGKVVAEGDLVDESWDIVWWGNSYPDSVNYWKLDVERDLPVHGNIHTYAEVIDYLKKQTKNAQDLCAHAEQSHLAMQGCPVSNTF